jgi:Beta/Gamma crystallin
MKFAHVLFATLAGGSVITATAQEITLFEFENFGGQRFSANGAMTNLDSTGFNDRASSAVVRSGTWQLCSDAFFRGNCVTLQPGSYPSLSGMGLNRSVSSLRETGWNNGGGGGGGTGSTRAELFENQSFSGRSIVVERAIQNFDQIDFNDRARSMIVYSGTWQLCTDAFFHGDCRDYGPGRYDSLGSTNGQTSSARPVVGGGGGGGGGGNGGGDNWGGGARVVMYEGPNFSGRSFVLRGDIVRNFDGTGFNDRAASLRIERGYWLFCSDADFGGQCRTFGPGDYPSLPNGLDSRISSGRKVNNDYPYTQPPNWR